MPTWPESVVQEVAERRAVFVVGARASMASVDIHGNHPRLGLNSCQSFLEN